MQNTAERLAQSVKQLADIRPRLCKEAEAELLRLALAIAQRILHRELNIDPDGVGGAGESQSGPSRAAGADPRARHSPRSPNRCGRYSETVFAAG